MVSGRTHSRYLRDRRRSICSQWETVDTDDEFTWLTTYELPDLAFLSTPEFATVTTRSQKYLPKDDDGEVGVIDTYVEFKTAAVKTLDSGPGAKNRGKYLVEVASEEKNVRGFSGKFVRNRMLERQGEQDRKWRYLHLLEMEGQPMEEEVKALKKKGKVRIFKLVRYFRA